MIKTVKTSGLMDRMPNLLPLAVAWTRSMENSSMKQGKPLAEWQIADARDVGVRRPQNVRLVFVDSMPVPVDPVLAVAAVESGLLSSNTQGLTFGYAVYILRTRIGERRLLRHELWHVAQYERCGGIEPFLLEYLTQVLTIGYRDAPLEQDARSFERRPVFAL
jgi:hypothetical protein